MTVDRVMRIEKKKNTFDFFFCSPLPARNNNNNYNSNKHQPYLLLVRARVRKHIYIYIVNIKKMVLIINGEVVPDSDPRAVERRRKSSGGATSNSGSNSFNNNSATRKTGITSLHDSSSAPAGSNRPPQAANNNNQQVNNEDGILAPLAVLLKVEGKKMVLPPIHQIGFEGASFPLVNVIFTAIVGLFSSSIKMAAGAFIILIILKR